VLGCIHDDHAVVTRQIVPAEPSAYSEPHSARAIAGTAITNREMRSVTHYEILLKDIGDIRVKELQAEAQVLRQPRQQPHLTWDRSAFARLLAGLWRGGRRERAGRPRTPVSTPA
jgi:hypothetical protein